MSARTKTRRLFVTSHCNRRAILNVTSLWDTISKKTKKIQVNFWSKNSLLFFFDFFWNSHKDTSHVTCERVTSLITPTVTLFRAWKVCDTQKKKWYDCRVFATTVIYFFFWYMLTFLMCITDCVSQSVWLEKVMCITLEKVIWYHITFSYHFSNVIHIISLFHKYHTRVMSHVNESHLLSLCITECLIHFSNVEKVIWLLSLC